MAHVKEMIVSAPVLAYYDVNKPVVIQCDASQSGLGAALLQEEYPVAYSSRVINQTEHNYAHIEKELLAIVYECEKFDQYIFGRSNVIVQSDHKPLETIFKKPIHSSPKRLQRMRLRLQNYGIQVEYKKGETMFLVDTLSRAYLENELVSQAQDSDVRSIRERLFAFELEQIKHGEDLSVSPTRLEKLREETAKDEELQILSDVMLKTFGIGDPLLSWFYSYLTGRRQRVVLNGTFSNWADFGSGVPQGSILGPILFLIFVNDMPNVINSATLTMFADDSKCYRIINNNADFSKLQEDLFSLAT